jgi:hypothetical protein
MGKGKRDNKEAKKPKQVAVANAPVTGVAAPLAPGAIKPTVPKK